MAGKNDGKPKYILGLRGNALVAAMTEFVIDCGIFLTDAFWSLYVLALSATITDLGLFSLITGLLPALFIAPAGLLGDRVSRKKVIVFGGFMAAPPARAERRWPTAAHPP